MTPVERRQARRPYVLRRVMPEMDHLLRSGGPWGAVVPISDRWEILYYPTQAAAFDAAYRLAPLPVVGVAA